MTEFNFRGYSLMKNEYYYFWKKNLKKNDPYLAENYCYCKYYGYYLGVCK